jgi:2-keto-3-deoxy-L-rhamnonate aldolase RhmA
MFAPDAAAATAWLERGVSLVLLGSDLALLAAAVADVWRALPERASPS